MDCSPDQVYSTDYISLDNYYCKQGGISSGNGYEYGIVSYPNIGYNGYSNPMTMTCSNGMFSLVSVWLTPAFASGDGMQVNLVGSYDGEEKARATLTLSRTNDPTFFDSELSDFVDIDTMVFSSPSHTVVDNFMISISSPCGDILKGTSTLFVGDGDPSGLV